MQAFTGIRVLDVTRVLAGPSCTYQLGLLGADVIKVEPPGTGETIRRSTGDRAMAQAGLSVAFLTQAANKRYLGLDLDHPDAAEVFLKLASRCDVVVENLRTGSMDRRGIGFEAVRAVKPEIVWCAISAYGRTGPKRCHPAYDFAIQAWSGLMSMTGTKETAPLRVGPPVIDYATGLAAAYAIAAALLHRHRTGEGQYIDLSMLETTLVLMSSLVTLHANTGVVPQPTGNDAASGDPASTVFETAQGLLAIATNEEHQFVHLMEQLGLRDMLDDARFQPGKPRRRHASELRQAIQERLRARPASAWEALLNEHGVPAARIRTISEALAEPQVAERGFLKTVPAAESGLDRELHLPLAPFRLAHDGPCIRSPAKQVGADDDAVLRELGYTDDALARFRATGLTGKQRRS